MPVPRPSFVAATRSVCLQSLHGHRRLAIAKWAKTAAPRRLRPREPNRVPATTRDQYGIPTRCSAHAWLVRPAEPPNEGRLP